MLLAFCCWKIWYFYSNFLFHFFGVLFFLLLDFNRQTGVYKPVNYQTDVWKDLRCLKLMKKLLMDLLTKYNCDDVIKPSYLLISINFCTFVSIAVWIKTRIKPPKCQYPATHLSQGHKTCWTAHNHGHIGLNQMSQNVELNFFFKGKLCHLSEIRECWISRRKSCGYLIQQHLFQQSTTNI